MHEWPLAVTENTCNIFAWSDTTSYTWPSACMVCSYIWLPWETLWVLRASSPFHMFTITMCSWCVPIAYISLIIHGLSPKRTNSSYQIYCGPYISWSVKSHTVILFLSVLRSQLTLWSLSHPAIRWPFVVTSKPLYNSSHCYIHVQKRNINLCP